MTNEQFKVFSPTIPLDPGIEATGDLAAVADADVVLLVTPAQHMRSVLEATPAGDRPPLVD